MLKFVVFIVYECQATVSWTVTDIFRYIQREWCVAFAWSLASAQLSFGRLEIYYSMLRVYLPELFDHSQFFGITVVVIEKVVVFVIFVEWIEGVISDTPERFLR